MRAVVVARVVAVGKVVKSGEQLSAVQLLRGVVMASVVSGSRKSSEVRGETLSSTTAERGCDGEHGEW